MFLPPPSSPHPDWSRLVAAIWNQGMSVKNMLPEHAVPAVGNASKAILDSVLERNEAKFIRPSSFLSCARQSYLFLKGEQSADMPDNIGTTFAIGHLLHELSYAAMKSGLPGCFTVQHEVPVNLPAWWPTDEKNFKQKGTIDMIISINDPVEAAKYLAPGQPETMLVDFKTQGSYSYRKHGKADYAHEPDGFGYMAQLATYADSKGILENGALLAGINRDSLTQPLKPRFISPTILHGEVARLKNAFEHAQAGRDPGKEFAVRHGKEANFFCGLGGSKGYCAFKDACKATPEAVCV
jgi:hypothetical protein